MPAPSRAYSLRAASTRNLRSYNSCARCSTRRCRGIHRLDEAVRAPAASCRRRARIQCGKWKVTGRCSTLVEETPQQRRLSARPRPRRCVPRRSEPRQIHVLVLVEHDHFRRGEEQGQHQGHGAAAGAHVQNHKVCDARRHARKHAEGGVGLRDLLVRARARQETPTREAVRTANSRTRGFSGSVMCFSRSCSGSLGRKPDR